MVGVVVREMEDLVGHKMQTRHVDKFLMLEFGKGSREEVKRLVTFWNQQVSALTLAPICLEVPKDLYLVLLLIDHLDRVI
jgi:hypothetical protein